MLEIFSPCYTLTPNLPNKQKYPMWSYSCKHTLKSTTLPSSRENIIETEKFKLRNHIQKENKNPNIKLHYNTLTIRIRLGK